MNAIVAAAEERGRRAGIEEAIAFVDGSFSYSLSVYAKQRLEDFLRSLAPRDSGPKHKDWCALYDNPEAGKSCDCHGDRP